MTFHKDESYAFLGFVFAANSTHARGSRLSRLSFTFYNFSHSAYSPYSGWYEQRRDAVKPPISTKPSMSQIGTRAFTTPCHRSGTGFSMEQTFLVVPRFEEVGNYWVSKQLLLSLVKKGLTFSSNFSRACKWSVQCLRCSMNFWWGQGHGKIYFRWCLALSRTWMRSLGCDQNFVVQNVRQIHLGMIHVHAPAFEYKWRRWHPDSWKLWVIRML